MNYLSVDQVSKSFGDREILNKVSFGVDQGEKVALVGINGSGKTTLLKIISGLIKPDSGNFSFRKGIRVAHLSQNPTFESNETIIEYILSGDDPKLNLVKRYEKLMQHMDEDTDPDLLTDTLAEMDSLQAWDLDSQIKQILGKLHIHDLDQLTDSLSGGQKKRVALARILIEKPDFMILDEPTNHLDLDSIEWLEQYISSQKMTLLLVTHDRYFLDSITNVIFEIDRQTIFTYRGNYANFLEKKAEREEVERTVVDKAKNLLRKELEWMRRQPRARGTKAKYRVEAFYDIKDKAQGHQKAQAIEIDLKTARSGKKILELEKISKSFPNNKLFESFSYMFKRGDRIGIIGKNGVGKSTFLNIIMNLVPPDSGTIDYGHNTKFGYYTQGELVYKEGQKAIDIIREIADFIEMGDGSQISASQLLQKFGFPPSQQYDFVDKFSGGEKRRLQLLKVLMGNPNFLILDEPTNDLDLMTLNTLEDYLETFPGCILMVSHDRYFMDRITDHLFVFEGNHEIRSFPGNFTDYRAKKAEEESQKAENEKLVEKKAPVKVKVEVEVKKTKKISYKEQQELEKLEKEIAALEVERNTAIEELNKGNDDHAEIEKLSKRIGEIGKSIDEKEIRWLELNDNG